MSGDWMGGGARMFPNQSPADGFVDKFGGVGAIIVFTIEWEEMIEAEHSNETKCTD